jgi:hypothetical protein
VLFPNGFLLELMSHVLYDRGTMRKARDPVEWFLSSFDQPETGCWLWKGTTVKKGYGRMSRRLAHRFSYEYFIGPIPEGQCVLHHCDTPGCVRFDHFFLGSRADNIADMDKKERRYIRRGEENNHAKLTEAQVAQIRIDFANGKSLNKVAKEYGLNLKTTQSIRRGTTWKHVPGPVFPEKHTPDMYAGSKNGQAVLTEAVVIQIREAAHAGSEVKELVQRYGVTRKSIENIIHGISWKSVGGPVSPRPKIAECIGENLPGSKLTEAMVREARRRYASGESGRVLADEFGVNSATMYTMLRGETWKHVT